MAAETSTHSEPTVVREQLYCALTGVPISADEAYWAPPLITAGELVRTIVVTLFRTPHNLGYLLMSEQDKVPYAQSARMLLAKRRSQEQFKLLLILLAFAALLILPIVFFSMQ